MSIAEAFRTIDSRLRSEETCEHCGKPIQGLQQHIGGRMRGTGVHGSAHLTGGYVETRSQAGLCTCVQIKLVMDSGESVEDTAPSPADARKDLLAMGIDTRGQSMLRVAVLGKGQGNLSITPLRPSREVA